MADQSDSGELETRFNQLYDATVRQTTVYLMVRCRRQADLEDLLQETYLELFRALHRTGTGQLRSGEALVRQIAKQRLFKYYRKLDGRDEIPLVREVAFADDLQLDLGDISQLEAFLNESSDDPAYDELVMEQIRASIEAASETDRKIINMRYGLELSLKEIAAALECPISTVKSRLYRFLAKAQKQHKIDGSGGFHEKE